MTLTLFGYCGMSIPLAEGDREDVRRVAACKLRRLRQLGFPIATLERGEQWEVQEPEDAGLVPDECGVLRIVPDPVYTRDCAFCEGEFKTEVPDESYCSLACQDHAGGWRCGDGECETCRREEDDDAIRDL